MGVRKVVAKFCAIPTPFRDHQIWGKSTDTWSELPPVSSPWQRMSQAGTVQRATPATNKEPEAQIGHKMEPKINKSINPKTLKLPEICGPETDTSPSVPAPHGPGGAGRLLHRSCLLLVLHRPPLAFQPTVLSTRSLSSTGGRFQTRTCRLIISAASQ